ncbi:FkbM family methyltransferase [Nonomuraea sp. NPDC050790]|uniref:FkbM family methyltransferase n=1 Tax=Nonomuraea sp. NPDC050790 TaxID=3364371 RepID=UPI00379B3419
MGLDYLRDDTDRVTGTPMGRIVVREGLGCARTLIDGARYGRGLSKIAVPYWMLRAFVGAGGQPLDGQDHGVWNLRTPGGDVQVCVRKNQSDVLIAWQMLLQRVYELDRVYACAPIGRLDTIVDLGANTGLAAAYLTARYRPATLVAVEPIPQNLTMLRRNAALSPTPWTIEDAAIAAHAGEREFAVSGMWCNCTCIPEVAKLRKSRPYRLENRLERPSVTVRTVTMDDLLTRRRIDRVDLLKVDIEGGEIEIFDGVRGWMERVERVVMEIHDKYIDGARVRDTLRRAGFHHVPPRGKAPASPNPLELYVRR